MKESKVRMDFFMEMKENEDLESAKARFDKDFQNKIKEINSVWNSEHVFFTQMRDGYSASYRPKYPGYCNEDMIIQTLEGTGAANRGNYELIIFAGGKFTSKYFDYVDEIKAYFKDRQKNGSI